MNKSKRKKRYISDEENWDKRFKKKNKEYKKPKKEKKPKEQMRKKKTP